MKLVPHLNNQRNTEPSEIVVDNELEEHLRQLSLLPSWPEYEQSTSDLAFDLCEQLRLVLAPTQATKLRGDYRTGKRLNLRKILPYIASQYRRDKIWLRRTKPSQRNYRICLSIDNSKSMMETGSVSLAFEAIATISQALERLEVGELALIGFGEHSRVLQQFSSGVAKVSVGDKLRSGLLCFDEASTDIPTLLETVLETFESALNNKSDPVWQLNVILSDGICHQHDKIKPLLARCHSARILNIFVLLDNRPVESSIFELSHVEYVEQGVDPMSGQVRTGIKMTKYLETFPFEFYVVLRDVKMLPNILAESLKQWFELISLQEGEH
jgi:midasin